MTDDNDSGRSLPLRAGSLGGVAAWLVGYAVTYVLTSGAVRESLLGGLGELAAGEDVTWQIVGWLFFNAHFVPTVVDIDVPIVGGTSASNFIAESAAFSPVLYAFPVVLLVVAGFVTASRRAGASPRDAVTAGAAVTVGYLPLSVAGAFLFRLTTDGSVAGPDRVAAVLIGGLAYPLVLGTVGAVVGQRTGDSAGGDTF